MKRITVILCVLALLGLAVWAQARMSVVVVGGGQAVAATCSGTFATGSVESFEKGAGQFCCTDGWTESDAGGVIDLYSTDYAKCGTHSAAITYNAGTGSNYIAFDLGSSATTTRYIRWYFKAPTIQTYKTMDLFQACADTGRSSCTFGITLDGGEVGGQGVMQTIKYGGSPNAGDYSQLTASGSEYRMELKIMGANGGTSEAKLFNSAGTQVGTTYTRSMDGGDAAYRYLIFYDKYNNNDSTPRTLYIDAVQIGTDDYLGAVSCP